MIKTIRFRIKDSNKGKLLDLMARDVNFVWNVLNSASRKKWKESRKYFHKYDPYFNQILTGASSELLINSETIQGIRDVFHKNIFKAKKQLRFRGKKSPKWIPFKPRTFKLKDGYFVYKKTKFRIWQSMKVPGLIKSGSITQDITGRWFVNIDYEAIKKEVPTKRSSVGIDLGFKKTATCSNGETLDVCDLKDLDKKIAKQQRAKNKKRVATLHLRKKNIKKDRFSKFALGLVKRNNLIAIGDITGFLKGPLGKSRYFNAWTLLKDKIKFKSEEYNTMVVEVSENLTTQTCNICGAIEGPKGIKGLSVRFWVCSCGAGLDRDINAAINILNRAERPASR